MTNLRTHRLVAVLAALTLTAAACSSSTDDNVTADTVDDVAAVTEVTELTTTTPTTTTPAMKDAMEEPTTTTVPTTNPTTNTTEVDAGVSDSTASQYTEYSDSFEAWRRERLTQKEADETAPNQLEAMMQENDTLISTADYPAKNRHPDSVLPDSAYLDHDAIRALFPECPPAYWTGDFDKVDWIVEHENYWFAVYENWDTEMSTVPVISGPREGESHEVASGWWTDEQLEMWMPGGGITEADARRDGIYIALLEDFLPYSGEPPVSVNVGLGLGDVAQMRLETIDGYDSSSSDLGDELFFVRRNGMDGYNTTTDIDQLGELVWNWMVFRLQQPPIDKEPTAWGIHTLLNTRSLMCLTEQMLEICNGERQIDSPLLEPSHRIGQTLRSLVCEFER